MTFGQASAVVIGLTAIVAWWFSGYDPRSNGWGRRLVWSLATVVVAEAIFWCGWQFSQKHTPEIGLLIIPLLLIIALLWAGAVSELFSRGFGKLFDSNSATAFNDQKGEAGLRKLNELVQEGRTKEAVKLGKRLEKEGDTNILVLQATMQRLGVDEKHVDKSKLLAQARQLHGERRFAVAEKVLTELIEDYPDYAEATVFLIRIYVQDLDKGAQAEELFEALKQRPGVSSGMVQIAANLILEASQSITITEAKTETVDDLIAQWRYGTAINILTTRTQEHPEDFAAWFKLAEINGRHCGSIPKAEEIVRRLESDGRFAPEQMDSLRTSVQEWRTSWAVPKNS